MARDFRTNVVWEAVMIELRLDLGRFDCPADVFSEQREEPCT